MTGTVQVLSSDDPTPTGSVVQAVGTSAAVYLLVKGRVDIDAEIEKAKAKLAKASEAVEKQRKIIHGENFEKRPVEAQENERQRLEERRAEIEVLEASVGQFERLKLE